jgi:energy-coupling factor transport system permease protein
MLVITFIMDIFFTDGEKLFSYYFLSISKEGIILGTRVCLKFMMFFIMSALMTYTTTIDDLASTLYALIRPLERFKFPANEAVLIITIALRFIPVIMEEYEKAYLALKSRGAFEIKNPLHLVCMLGKLIKVMFLSAINRARDITVAMEIRCYR